LTRLKGMVATAGPQLKVIVPPPVWAVVRALSKAASVQLAAVPLPTTALAARAPRPAPSASNRMNRNPLMTRFTSSSL